MALIERKAGDYEQFQRINTFNSKLIQEITDFRSRTIETSRPILENLKETDTLQKLMLTDNNGQHKNRRNENRTTIGTTNIALEEEIYDMY